MSGPSSGLRGRLAKNFGFLAIARFGRALTPIILTPLFLKVWGTEQYGDWLAVGAIPAAMMIFQDGGISSSLANVMGGLDPDKDSDAARLQALAFQGSFVAASVIFFACALLGTSLLLNLSLSTFDLVEAFTCFSIISVTSCCSLLTNSFLGYFRYREIESEFLRAAGVVTVTEIVATILILWLFPHPIVVALGVTVIRIVLCAWAFARTQALGWWREALVIPSLASYRPYVSSSLGFAGLPIVVVTQNQAILLLIHATFGATTASIYQITKTYANSIQLVTGTLYMSLLPELPRLWTRGELKKIAKLCWRSLQITTGGATMLAGLLWVLGPRIFRLWTGNEVEFYPLLGAVLLMSAATTATLNCSTALPRAANRVHRLVVPFLVLNILAIAIVFFASNQMSVSQICLVMLVAEALSTVYAIRLLRAMIRTRTNQTAAEQTNATGTRPTTDPSRNLV